MNQKSQSAAVHWLGQRYQEFMHFSWRRLVLVAAMLVGITYYADSKTQAYYASFSMPPSFRHMDDRFLDLVLEDYIDAQQVDENTILATGDCVIFGHGVKHSFTDHMLPPPGMRIVNVSMQSLRPSLALKLMHYAATRGVRNYLIQLHPFVDYVEDGTWFRERSHNQPITYEYLIADADRREDANWLQPSAWSFMADWVRGKGLQQWSLYRNRFAIDDWSGLKLSTYTSRTNRIDSYHSPLPEQRQIDIVQNKPDFWSLFKVGNSETYQEIAGNASFVGRSTRLLSSIEGARAAYVMPPTIVDLITDNTELNGSDFTMINTSLKNTVEDSGYKFYNYLFDKSLAQHMRHFDNLTVDGQKMLAERLQQDQLFDYFSQRNDTP